MVFAVNQSVSQCYDQRDSSIMLLILVRLLIASIQSPRRFSFSLCSAFKEFHEIIALNSHTVCKAM